MKWPSLAPSGIVVLGILAAVVFLLRHDRNPSDNWIQAEFPHLNPGIAELLLDDDPERLFEFSRHSGNVILSHAYAKIDSGVCGESAEELAENSRRLFPLLERLALCLAENHCIPAYYDNLQFLKGLPLEKAFERYEIVRRHMELRKDWDTSQEDRVPIYEKAIKRLQVLGDRWHIGNEYWYLGNTYMYLDDSDRELEYSKRSVQAFREVGNWTMFCQYGAFVGGKFEARGEVDSMWGWWNAVQSVADSCRLALQAARIRTTFQAVHHVRAGRLAIAEALFEEASQVARKLKSGPASELRFLNLASAYSVNLGAWGKLRSQLERGRVLWENTPERDRIHYSDLGLMLNEARFFMHTGLVEEGNALFKRLIRDTVKRSMPNEYTDYHLDWATELIAIGDFKKALEVADEGLRSSIEVGQPSWTVRLQLLKARAELELGMFRECESTLAELKVDDLSPLAKARLDAMTALAAMGRGKKAQAAGVLERGIRDLHALVQTLDGSEQAFMILSGIRLFREALYRVAGDDPLNSYRLEMSWRKLLALLGSPEHEWAESQRRNAEEELLTLIRGGQIPERSEIPKDEGLHLLYGIFAEAIVRWESSPLGVLRDTLSISPRELRGQITPALRALSKHPEDGEGIPEDLEIRLEALARILLPEAVMKTGGVGTPLVRITVDDFLSGFPFETLDLRKGPGYQPLIAEHDVAYVRFDAVRSFLFAAVEKPVVVVDPEIPKSMRLRYPFLGPLSYARTEGSRAAAMIPGSVVLQGAAASKAGLLDVWEEAPLIYVAGHTVRDPESPYLSFIPLAALGGSSRLADAYLERLDIRRADLSGCNVVVLSSCSSGAPFVTLTTTAPSLGDAFLDAGAQAVVQTFWDVGDRMAWEVMEPFQDRWLGEGGDPVRSLNGARRERAFSGDEPLHPFLWAGHHIRLGTLQSHRTSL